MTAPVWPPLPRIVGGSRGPITVRIVRRVTGEKGEACWGTWEQGRRTVRIERGARREHQWAVLFHELVHAAVDDAGLCHLLSEDAQETLCDAVATARMAELRGAR